MTTPLRNSLWIFLSAIIGAAMVAAFSPVGWSLLAFTLPALLMYTWFHASPKQAAWQGLAFGVGFFGVGISWVFISIHRFGDANAAIAFAITFGFVLLLSSPHILQAYLLQRYFPQNTVYKILALFPASWVFIEWLRDWLFTGFPWLYLASSQTNGFFKGYLPVMGSFGTGGLMIFSAGLIYLCFARRGIKRLCYFLLLVGIILLGWNLSKIEWTKPEGKPLNVSLVQGNIPQSIKWDPDNLELSLTRYWQLTKQQPVGQVIIWPENSIPLPTTYADEYLSKVNDYAQQHHQEIALGIPVPAGDNFFNSLLTLGRTHDVYYKRHLVPFGEYVPFENLLRGLIDFFDLPMSEFVSGEKMQSLVRLQGISVAPFICYEIAYSALVRQDLPKAQLFVVISDDAWFGDSLAPWQHLQITQMQAISSGRDLLSATNNGITAIISAQGEILKMAPRNQIYVLKGQVQPRNGLTPWAWFGNLPFIFLAIILLLVGMILCYYKNNK